MQTGPRSQFAGKQYWAPNVNNTESLIWQTNKYYEELLKGYHQLTFFTSQFLTYLSSFLNSRNWKSRKKKKEKKKNHIFWLFVWQNTADKQVS